MDIILLFLFACAGITSIFIDSNLFAKPRRYLAKILPSKIYDVITCYQCCGTWVGMILGYFMILHGVAQWDQVHTLAYILAFGGAGSLASWWSNLLKELVLSHTMIEIPDDPEDDSING